NDPTTGMNSHRLDRVVDIKNPLDQLVRAVRTHACRSSHYKGEAGMPGTRDQFARRGVGHHSGHNPGKSGIGRIGISLATEYAHGSGKTTSSESSPRRGKTC